MTYFDSHYYALNNFKKGQLESNRQDIIDTLGVLGDATPEQILRYLEKRNHNEASALYDKGVITRAEIKKYCKERTLSKRTIHRHLSSLLKNGWIEHVDDNYRLADKVKNDVIYWSHKFGDSILYALMRSYYPQLLTFEQNIEELIRIFGVYVLYCLAKAAQPYADENLNSEDNSLDRDKLIVSWVNEVFHPQRMLDYFIASMSHVPSDDMVHRIWDNTFTKNHNMPLGGLEKNKISDASRNKDIRWIDENGHNFSPESAYGLYTHRFWQTLLPVPKSSNTTVNSFYILNGEIIRKITEVIEKKYSTYYKDMVQNTKGWDIVKMTNSYQEDMERWLLLATDKHDGIKD
jgi:DNA-binding transcriptional ArsR family regulator